MTHPRSAADCLLGGIHGPHGGCPGTAGPHPRSPWPDADVVIQPRCVFCKRDHYTLAAPAISHGEAGCHHCGRISPVFTDDADYQAALARPALETFPFDGHGPR